MAPSELRKIKPIGVNYLQEILSIFKQLVHQFSFKMLLFFICVLNVAVREKRVDFNTIAYDGEYG